MNKDKYICPCCGYITLEEEPERSYEICEVCYWEIDPIQIDKPDYEGGANSVSLRQAQRNFIEFGASDIRFITSVRKPLPGEERDVTWKPFM